jgi:ADP-ribosylglycohydrolase
MIKDVDKITGCLIGVAIGDGLGAPFEGKSPSAVSREIKASGGLIRDFYPFHGKLGAWTDDTGMTLASVRALIKHEKAGRSLEKCFRDAFKTWINSDECRAPGRTVTYAAKYGVADKNSYATGAIMRISPIAIYSFLKGFTIPQTANLAYWAANLTHGHPLATFPAVECSLALLSILRAEEYTPREIVDPEAILIRLDPDQEEERPLYRRLRNLPAEDQPLASGLSIWKCVLERLRIEPGKPWAGLPPYREGIIKAVNSCPDRDTSGAVAGAILGAYWGLSGIPETWRTRVEKAEMIGSLARGLIEATRSPAGKKRGRRSASVRGV